MKIKVRSPRFGRQQIEWINGNPRVALVADSIAERQRFAPGEHTLAVDGLTLKRDDTVQPRIYDGAKVELVLR